LGLTGFETFFILGIEDIQPRKVLQVTAVKEDSQPVPFEVLTRLDTDMDLDYFLHGGILPYVLRKLVQ
jgi:aconitate hydratase